MNKVEFIKECATRGYCNKQQAKTYCKKHDKDDYAEQDFIDVYRYYESIVEKYDNPNYDYVPIDRCHGYKVTPLRPYYD